MHPEEIRRRKPLVFKVSAVKCTWPSIFWWTTSWNLIKIRFPLPERTMRLIILTPNALHDVYTVSAGQDFFSMLRFLLKHERKKKEEKISIPLGFHNLACRRPVELGWDTASPNTGMPGQLDMLHAFDSVPCEPWCVQLNTLHLHAPVQPDYTSAEAKRLNRSEILLKHILLDVVSHEGLM